MSVPWQLMSLQGGTTVNFRYEEPSCLPPHTAASFDGGSLGNVNSGVASLIVEIDEPYDLPACAQVWPAATTYLYPPVPPGQSAPRYSRVEHVTTGPVGQPLT